ncbi:MULTISPECIES: DUF6171 family protein [Enterococcus]|uniref:Uncharacterized protein n=1 Tax=Enterococcus ureasiticus TaxID=903984 RepID=A0A1E5GDR9_9ENTE|nr:MULTISPECIES: DUF6171 family protein [Enterococcus]OEG10807.1 hypothetical protein BCR21_10960 [Enterococcus ureasiticus]
MSCIGCEIKESTTNLDVQQLIEEQLLLETNVVKEQVKIKRIKLCETCPFRVAHTCSKCGCFFEFRASLAVKKCPVGHW